MVNVFNFIIHFTLMLTLHFSFYLLLSNNVSCLMHKNIIKSYWKGHYNMSQSLHISPTIIIALKKHIMVTFNAAKPRRPLQSYEHTLTKDDTKSPRLGNYFSEYLMHSTLHGLRYIGDVTLSLFERYFQFN